MPPTYTAVASASGTVFPIAPIRRRKTAFAKLAQNSAAR